jgi:TolB-like protein
MSTIYNFEGYSLDPDRRELRDRDALVSVEPQVFDLLQYLIRNRDHIVSKDDLITGVWDGRVVSDSTLSSRLTAVRQAVGDSGEKQQLIRTIPHKGFRFIGEVHETKRADHSAQSVSGPGKRAGLFLPQKPSIAVLPFANLSGDPDQEYFVDGITEDIITALSQFRWLSVIAGGSRLALDGRAIDARDIHELGVGYVLDGSVRKSENRVRITARLIDATTGIHLWASRFDGKLDDAFDLQDKVTASVVGVTAPKLEQAEIERAKQQPLESPPDPYRCYLLGTESVYRWTRGGVNEGLRLFQQAIQINPEFAPAYGMAAYCYVQRKSYGWLTDRRREIVESEQLARRAAELAGDDAAALTRAAHAIASVAGDIDSGFVFVEQALRHNRNLAPAWYVSGWLRIFRGEPQIAVEHLARAINLGPLHPLMFKMQCAMAYAHFLTGCYDEASAAAENALRARPNYLTAVRAAAASHALAGGIDRARTLMAQMRQCDPALRISSLSELIPFRRALDFARWAEGLHKAGLPD